MLFYCARTVHVHRVFMDCVFMDCVFIDCVFIDCMFIDCLCVLFFHVARVQSGGQCGRAAGGLS